MLIRRYVKTVKEVFSIAGNNPFYVTQLFISDGISSLASLLPPIATAGIIGVITDNNFKGIWFYVVLYCVFYAIYFVTLFWNYRIYYKLSGYYYITVQRQLFAHIINNDNIFNYISKGEITETCAEDVKYLIEIIDNTSSALMFMIRTVVIFFIFSYYNIFIAGIALAFDLLYFYLMDQNSKKVSHAYEGIRKYEDKINDIFHQMIINRRQVRTLNMLPSLNRRLTRTQNEWGHQYKGRRDGMVRRYCVMPSIVYIGKIFIYIILGYQVIRNRMTIDTMVLLISYFELTIESIDEALEYLLNISNNAVRIKRIRNILDYRSDENIEFGDITNDYINGSIKFDDVCYDIKGKPILKNVSFKILPNQVTAIVGPAGSGKTTIFNLLYRRGRVKSGSILMDDESIYNYSKKVYASNLTGVSPKPFVFKMSIEDNLALIDPNHQHQINACKRVGVHDVIMKLPKGYKTIIDDDSRLLTDGQKQLISIARSLLSRAEIILLDQVTSTVDVATTKKIAKLVRDLSSDHTVVIITHSPEMMKTADRVIVLNNGKVAAQGSNEAVLKRSNLYQGLLGIAEDGDEDKTITKSASKKSKK